MTEQNEKHRPFHETVVEAIKRASGAEMGCLARLIKATKIPKNHSAIVAAWTNRLFEVWLELGKNKILCQTVAGSVFEQMDEVEKLRNENLFRSVDELELSVRSARFLKEANIRLIGDLVQRTEDDLIRSKTFGLKSVDEIKGILAEMGLTLGMLAPGTWPPRRKEEE